MGAWLHSDVNRKKFAVSRMSGASSTGAAGDTGVICPSNSCSTSARAGRLVDRRAALAAAIHVVHEAPCSDAARRGDRVVWSRTSALVAAAKKGLDRSLKA